ncbi:MAG: hypothetical protein IT267_01375 [Saprospiraceae bacterium]|nr:hypothetical protein [Saprospiraceae bacterium]
MRAFILFILCFISFYTFSQTQGYGVRAGVGLSSQKWQGGGQRDPLFTYHGDLYYDSESEKGNVFYLALGYHLRGSALIFPRYVDQYGNTQPGGSLGMKFHQIGLEIGVKKAKKFDSWKALYGFGLRGEYNAKTQISVFQEYNNFINKATFGLTLSGGVEKNMSKFLVIGLEARVSPDLTRQIFVPQGTLYYDPFTNGVRPGPGESIKNFGIELSLILKFLQIVEYIEEF